MQGEFIVALPMFDKSGAVEGWHMRVLISPGLHANNCFFVNNYDSAKQAHETGMAWANGQLRERL